MEIRDYLGMFGRIRKQARKINLSPSEMELLLALGSHEDGKIARKEVIELTGYSRRAINVSLNSLIDEGFVLRDKGYFLTDNGRRLYEETLTSLECNTEPSQIYC